MNDKARQRAHDIYFKIVEFLKAEFTGIVTIRVTILKGCITRAQAAVDQDIKFSEGE